MFSNCDDNIQMSRALAGILVMVGGWKGEACGGEDGEAGMGMGKRETGMGMGMGVGVDEIGDVCGWLKRS